MKFEDLYEAMVGHLSKGAFKRKWQGKIRKAPSKHRTRNYDDVNRDAKFVTAKSVANDLRRQLDRRENELVNTIRDDWPELTTIPRISFKIIDVNVHLATIAPVINSRVIRHPGVQLKIIAAPDGISIVVGNEEAYPIPHDRRAIQSETDGTEVIPWSKYKVKDAADNAIELLALAMSAYFDDLS